MRIPISTIARVLAGESSCLHRLWHELRAPRSADDSARLAAWVLDHSRAVRATAEKLEGDLQAEVKVNHEAGFRGRVDLLERTAEGLTVHEIKTGRASQADLMQLMLYMAVMSEKGRNVTDGVLHRPTTTVCVPHADLPPRIIEDAARVAVKLQASTPPARIQERACGFCRVSCPFNSNAHFSEVVKNGTA